MSIRHQCCMSTDHWSAGNAQSHIGWNQCSNCMYFLHHISSDLRQLSIYVCYNPCPCYPIGTCLQPYTIQECRMMAKSIGQAHTLSLCSKSTHCWTGIMCSQWNYCRRLFYMVYPKGICLRNHIQYLIDEPDRDLWCSDLRSRSTVSLSCKYQWWEGSTSLLHRLMTLCPRDNSRLSYKDLRMWYLNICREHMKITKWSRSICPRVWQYMYHLLKESGKYHHHMLK